MIGDREAQEGTVAVRRRDGIDCGVIKVADCAAKLCEEVRSRALVPSIGPAAAAGGNATT